MRQFAAVAALAALFVLATGAQAPPQASRPSWAFLNPDKDQPKVEEHSGPVKIPGSAKEYTEKQIDDLANPPDWFPEEHGALPKVVQGGPGSTALACGACHLMWCKVGRDPRRSPAEPAT
jgi:hypothetical protein